ncbi:MAG: hypothetical protein K2G83_05915 [Ruminococcus sp.]|nr:hypothetical protein [Ruminococcus sp.]
MDLIKEIYFKLSDVVLLKAGLFDESKSTTDKIIALIKSNGDENFWNAHIENVIIDAQVDSSIKAFREGFKAAFRLMREVSE